MDLIPPIHSDGTGISNLLRALTVAQNLSLRASSRWQLPLIWRVVCYLPVFHHSFVTATFVFTSRKSIKSWSRVMFDSNIRIYINFYIGTQC